MQLNKLSKIFIAGHNGMVGSAILNHFRGKNEIFLNHSYHLVHINLQA